MNYKNYSGYKLGSDAIKKAVNTIASYYDLTDELVLDQIMLALDDVYQEGYDAAIADEKYEWVSKFDPKF